MKYQVDGWMDGLGGLKQIAFEPDDNRRERIQQAKAMRERHFKWRKKHE